MPSKVGNVARIEDVADVDIGSQSIAGGDVSGSLDQRGYVRSNAHFQIEGHDNIFAVGDVVSHPSREIKQAYYAEMNGKAAAINVMRAAAGQRGPCGARRTSKTHMSPSASAAMPMRNGTLTHEYRMSNRMTRSQRCLKT